MNNILQVKDIKYKVQNLQILNGISFNVDQGEHLTITGPSGSGKSTMLKVIASLITQTSGVILFNGEDTLKLLPIKYRREVSYCVQQPHLFGTTVRDNLEFPFIIRHQAIDTQKISNSLKEVSLDDSYLDRNINDVSGGERERIAMIRNLLFSPKVLLLDEVTTGLDNISKNIVINLISQKIKEGVTVLEITHDDEQIENAKKLLVINKGQVDKDESRGF